MGGVFTVGFLIFFFSPPPSRRHFSATFRCQLRAKCPVPGARPSPAPSAAVGTGASLRTRREEGSLARSQPARLWGLAAAAAARCASWHHSRSSNPPSELPFLTRSVGLSALVGLGPSRCRAGSSPGEARLRSRWRRKGREGERVGGKRIVRNGTKQRSARMKFISAYYLLPLFPALVFSARWVPRAILLRVLFGLVVCFFFFFSRFSALRRNNTDFSFYWGSKFRADIFSDSYLSPSPSQSSERYWVFSGCF